MGRFGNVYLVNGEPRYGSGERGEVVRFFHQRRRHAHVQPFVDGLPLKVVASDVGNFERETWAESAVIAPLSGTRCTCGSISLETSRW
jgi:hypothetical protein